MFSVLRLVPNKDGCSLILLSGLFFLFLVNKTKCLVLTLEWCKYVPLPSCGVFIYLSWRTDDRRAMHKGRT